MNAVDGLEETLTLAFTTHHAALLRQLTAYTRDRDAAEDIVQEAFVRLTRSVSAGATPDDVGAWTYRVAMNLAASRGRKLQTARRYPDASPRPAPEPGPVEMCEARELGRRLAEALTLLPADHRQAILMAAQGLSSSAVAAVLGRTTGATRTLLCRARSRVRADLALA